MIVRYTRPHPMRGMGAPQTTADFTPEALGLPSLDDYADEVAAALLGASTDAQARAATGAATNRIADGYLMLVDLGNSDASDPDLIAARKAELDTANAALAAPYAAIPNDSAAIAATQAATDAWFQLVPIINQVYLTVYQLELYKKQGDAMVIVDLSPISLLKLAIAKAGNDIAGVISAIGDAATQATKGFVMSAWLPIGLIAVGGVLYLFAPAIKSFVNRKLA